MTERADAQYKVLIIGDSGIGKTCFLQRFSSGLFKPDHMITIGVQHTSKLIQIGNKNIKLQIWDTAGTETFRAITRSFYRNANAVILMYDLTCKESFGNLDGWMKEIKQNTGGEVIVFLVGNMLDLEFEREVSREEAEKYKMDKKLNLWMEVSAKGNWYVQEVFKEVARQLWEKMGQEQPQFARLTHCRVVSKSKCC